MTLPDQLQPCASPPASNAEIEGFKLGGRPLPSSARRFYAISNGLAIPELSTQLLSLAAAAEYGKSIASLPDARRYGLLPITESNDSNPYCLILGEKLNGAVMLLSHDGETRVTHGSMQGFLQSLATLLEQGGGLIDDLAAEDIQDARLIADADAMLGHELKRWFTDMHPFVPLLSACSPQMLVRLLGASDMWVREEAALQCGRRGLLETRDALRQLADAGDRQDNHAARDALAALRRKLPRT